MKIVFIIILNLETLPKVCCSKNKTLKKANSKVSKELAKVIEIPVTFFINGWFAAQFLLKGIYSIEKWEGIQKLSSDLCMVKQDIMERMNRSCVFISGNQWSILFKKITWMGWIIK